MAFVTRSVINPVDGKWKWAMNEQVFDTVCEFKKERNFYRLRFGGDIALKRIFRRYLAFQMARFIEVATPVKSMTRFNIFNGEIRLFLINHC